MKARLLISRLKKLKRSVYIIQAGLMYIILKCRGGEQENQNQREGIIRIIQPAVAALKFEEESQNQRLIATLKAVKK